MRRVVDIYTAPGDLVLGHRLNTRVPEADQKRQRREVDELLSRLRKQPGVVLADEVGMGKTYVALAIAYSIAVQSSRGPVIIMVPANLVDKWEQDLKAFCDLYLVDRKAVRVDLASDAEKKTASSLRYGTARHSVELMKLLDDEARIRPHLIFLAQGAMSRKQTDKWVRLALISEALRRHGRGGADRLIQVKKQIHRFLAKLLWAIGEEKGQDLGEELWQRLLRSDPGSWKEMFNEGVRNGCRTLKDDPVPKTVVRSLDRVELRELADALQEMPVRARGGVERVDERLDAVRTKLREVEEKLWKDVLRKSHWRSPLLVMDEAHHLKNPGTALARQLQSAELTEDLSTGDGAMAAKFDRMIFLTATPFQLGHSELVRVLERFGDVRWDETELGAKEGFSGDLKTLRSTLDESQRAAVALRHAWGRLRPEDFSAGGDVEEWWRGLLKSDNVGLTSHQAAVVEKFQSGKRARDIAEGALQPWLVRHNKGEWWSGTTIRRRLRQDGAAIGSMKAGTGLPIPPEQLLPFFLAARSAVRHDRDLLGDALCSSYEAFRDTRKNRQAAKDELNGDAEPLQKLSRAGWYLEEFDGALEKLTGAVHPKVAATARKVLELWERGEKVLVFAFYRHSCRALRVHISAAIERHIQSLALHRIRAVSPESDERDVARLIEKAQKRFFDDLESPGRREMHRAISGILESQKEVLERAAVAEKERKELQDILARFLRVESTLARCFPLEALDSLTPAEAVRRTLDSVDASGVSWREKFWAFVAFLAEQCTADERTLYLEVAGSTKTGRIRVERDEDDQIDGKTEVLTLANVQVATGTTKRETRSRLMRAFNTPFFPDVLVCSEVMGEGVDLQRFCRHVIHHDLDWNPSTIEQRTGRIDRLGCKAEGRHPIEVYLPYLAGTADERQYQVMSERERWFRVVMGQEKVAELITADSSCTVPLPVSASDALTFDLGLGKKTSKLQ
jgi:superfamily II DNA or RNA helicase